MKDLFKKTGKPEAYFRKISEKNWVHNTLVKLKILYWTTFPNYADWNINGAINEWVHSFNKHWLSADPNPVLGTSLVTVNFNNCLRNIYQRWW